MLLSVHHGPQGLINSAHVKNSVMFAQIYAHKAMSGRGNEIHASKGQVFHALCDLSCIMPLLIGANSVPTRPCLMKYCLAPAASCTYFIGQMVQINSNRSL